MFSSFWFNPYQAVKNVDMDDRRNSVKLMEEIGAEFDYLVEQSPSGPPTLGYKKPSKHAAVLSSMRNEGITILEWVAHYRVLGFDSIIIYTNDNEDGSDMILSALHRAGIVSVINNIIPSCLPPQRKAYSHAFLFNEALWDHIWVAVMDADEFLIPFVDGRQESITEYTEHLDASYDFSCISLNWKWFPTDRSFSRAEGLLFGRFRNAVWNEHVKSLFRLRDVANIGVHCPTLLPNMKSISGTGAIRAKPEHPKEEPRGSRLGQVNHYWGRSFEEFYVKRQRGRGSRQRELRPWSAFLWGSGSNTEPEMHPEKRHIDAVKFEMERLRRVPGVTEAEHYIEKSFRACVSSTCVRKLYEDTIAGK